MSLRQHWSLHSIDSRNHNEVNTKLGDNTWTYNYRYACCRLGCAVSNALKFTLSRQGPCLCANTGACAPSIPSIFMRSTPKTVTTLGLQLSLRTWLLSPQRLKVDTPKQDPCLCANTGACALSIPATSMRSTPSSVTTLGHTIIVMHVVDLVAQSPTP